MRSALAWRDFDSKNGLVTQVLYVNRDCNWRHTTHSLVEDLKNRGIADIAALDNPALRAICASLLLDSDEDGPAGGSIRECHEVIHANAVRTTLKIRKLTLAL
jgi:hypothetical protein